jgi:hypothetical protein
MILGGNDLDWIDVKSTTTSNKGDTGIIRGEGISVCYQGKLPINGTSKTAELVLQLRGFPLTQQLVSS